jgi:type IV secretory pathway TrbD component
MGCDRNKVYDVITFCAIAIFVFHTWYSILFGVIAMPVALGFLRMLGKKHPYFFAIYKRQRRTQAVYKRAATMHAPLPRIPQQQQS